MEQLCAGLEKHVKLVHLYFTEFKLKQSIYNALLSHMPANDRLFYDTKMLYTVNAKALKHEKRAKNDL